MHLVIRQRRDSSPLARPVRQLGWVSFFTKVNQLPMSGDSRTPGGALWCVRRDINRILEAFGRLASERHLLVRSMQSMSRA